MKVQQFFLILLCLFYQTIDALRILAISPHPSQSHFNTFAKLGKALAGKGHQLDVYSHFPLKNPIPNYRDYSLAEALPQKTNNLSYEYTVQLRQGGLRDKQIIGYKICTLLDTSVFQNLIKHPPQDPPYDVIINEVFYQNCFIALKRHLNVPMVGLRACSFYEALHLPFGAPYNTAIDTRFEGDFEHPMSFYERIINTIEYYQSLVSYRYYLSAQNEIIEKHFGPGYPGAADILKDFDLVLLNSHYTLEGIRAYPPNVVQVGGLHVDTEDKTPLPKAMQEWLDASDHGCIYISFGSMVRIETLPKSTLEAFYATFRNIAPVRVLMKIMNPENLPVGLPSNVLTQKWFPQVQILKHKNVRAFVTHGGLLGTIESIVYGVPMIGMPLFGDQPFNIRQYVKGGIAIRLEVEQVTEKSFTEALNEVIHNPTYKNNAMILSRRFSDRPMTPIDTAIFWIEYIARHGSGALRPPIVDLAWWKASLLDVYGFFLLTVILIYCAVKCAFTKLLIMTCYRE